MDLTCCICLRGVYVMCEMIGLVRVKIHYARSAVRIFALDVVVFKVFLMHVESLLEGSQDDGWDTGDPIDETDLVVCCW